MTIQIPTAGGAIESPSLGTTLMHEHVFVLSTEMMQNYPAEWGDEETRVANAIDRMNELVSHGVDSLVDLTVIGLGRYIPRIRRIAEKTKLNILVATGVYTYGDVPMYFHFRTPGSAPKSPDVMADMFVRDIEEGIADTGIRAAMLKCATDAPGLTRDVERILRAVAQAHRRTGTPISTHTHAKTKRGLDQQRVFREEGVDLERVVIGHSGDTTDIDYLEALISEGSYIGMDRFGVDTLLPFEDRVRTVATMCARGHAGKMVLSQDAACFNDWFNEGVVSKVLPRWNYLHIHRDVIPALKKAGVTDEQLKTMLVDNPRKIFENRRAYG